MITNFCCHYFKISVFYLLSPKISVSESVLTFSYMLLFFRCKPPTNRQQMKCVKLVILLLVRFRYQNLVDIELHLCLSNFSVRRIGTLPYSVLQNTKFICSKTFLFSEIHQYTYNYSKFRWEKRVIFMFGCTQPHLALIASLKHLSGWSDMYESCEGLEISCINNLSITTEPNYLNKITINFDQDRSLTVCNK